MSERRLPKDERGWVGYYTADHELAFVLTSKRNSRDWYYMYQVCGDQLKKLGKARSPLELERKFEVDRKTRGE